MDPNTWNGLTGKEVREKIQNIESQVNKTDTTVKNLFNEEEKIKSKYLPSYVDDTVEGKFDENNKFCPYDIENQEYSEPIEQGEKSKIYYDRENLISYRWSGSKYIEIVNGDEIQQRLNNFNANDETKDSIEKKIENISSNVARVDGLITGITDRFNDYCGQGKSIEQFLGIGKTLPTKDVGANCLYLLVETKNNGDTPIGLYISKIDHSTGTPVLKWQRVGGLL
jgi:hypothetical protein